jgi:hypothetical protein
LPYYPTEDLARTIAEVEANNERVIAVVREAAGRYSVITEPRVDDTGRPWLPLEKRGGAA